MKKPSFKKTDRIAAIVAATELGPDLIRIVLDAEDEAIAKGLAEGKRVYLDNVGTLHLVNKPATRRYNPAKKTTMDVPERVVVKFVASKTLKERV